MRFERGISAATVLKLADADAFRSMRMDRRTALWESSALQDRPVGMFTEQDSESKVETPVDLPTMAPVEHVFADYATTGFSVKGHPVSFIREKLDMLGISTAAQLSDLPNGTPVKIAGLVLIRQRPSTSKGLIFITTEDETDVVNIVVFLSIFQQYRQVVCLASLLMVEGTLQREGQVIHVIAKSCYDMRQLLEGIKKGKGADPPIQALSRANEDLNTTEKGKHNINSVQTELFPKSRDFR